MYPSKARVACALGAPTWDGWLKLCGEPGWVPAECVRPESGEEAGGAWVCAVEVVGETRLLTGHGVVLDPSAEDPLGIWSPEAPLGEAPRALDGAWPGGAPGAWEGAEILGAIRAGRSEAEEEPELAVVHLRLRQAEKRVGQRLYRAAAQAYGEAMDASDHNKIPICIFLLEIICPKLYRYYEIMYSYM